MPQFLRHIKGRISTCCDVLWALFATHLAKRGHIALGRAILGLENLRPSLPHRVRVRLAAAVGWQEGIRNTETL